MNQNEIINIDQPPLNFWEKIYLPSLIKGMFLTLRHIFRRKRTMHYPQQRREQLPIRQGGIRNSIYRGVHRLNKDTQGRVECVACFMCETACPADCIHIVGAPAPWPDREKYPVQFDIDELRCIYCGMCEYACPVDAIELTPIYNLVGLSRKELYYDIDKLLEIYDQTKDLKPRKNPAIVGYHCSTKSHTVEHWRKITEKL